MMERRLFKDALSRSKQENLEVKQKLQKRLAAVSPESADERAYYQRLIGILEKADLHHRDQVGVIRR
ncbi:MAG: hypothetical protein HQL56_19005 [Magnetococcales bacterium]|nr:hypothetical protein [Magnetococcales bacterium]